MEQDNKIDKDYKEAFNQGYVLAKELGLKPEILKGLNAGKKRIQAMKVGMEQHSKELTQTKQKERDRDVIPPLDIDRLDDRSFDQGMDIEPPRNKDRGMEFEI